MTAMERAAALLHDAHLRYQRAALKPESQRETAICPIEAAEVRGVSFVEPRSRQWQAQHRDYRPAGFYRIHCSHDKLLWTTCVTCKRDSREAQRNFVRMVRGERF